MLVPASIHLFPQPAPELSRCGFILSPVGDCERYLGVALCDLKGSARNELPLSLVGYFTANQGQERESHNKGNPRQHIRNLLVEWGYFHKQRHCYMEDKPTILCICQDLAGNLVRERACGRAGVPCGKYVTRAPRAFDVRCHGPVRH